MSKRKSLFGDLVAAARTAAGVRQADVAARCGCSAAWVAKVEAGTGRASPAMVLELVAMLGLDQREAVDAYLRDSRVYGLVELREAELVAEVEALRGRVAS